MRKFEIELSDIVTVAVGNNATDVESFLEILSPAIARTISDNAELFTRDEWLGMAAATRGEVIKSGLEGIERLLSFIVLAEKYGDMSGVAELKEKLSNMLNSGTDDFAIACLLETLRFGHRHFASQLGAEEWWTLSARNEVETTSSAVVAQVARKLRRGPKPGSSRKRRDTKVEESPASAQMIDNGVSYGGVEVEAS